MLAAFQRRLKFAPRNYQHDAIEAIRFDLPEIALDVRRLK